MRFRGRPVHRRIEPPTSSGMTGSCYGFLFSIPAEPERLGQMQRRVVQRQAMHRRPQVQRVSLGRALSVKASERVLAQGDREGAPRRRGVAVQRAGAATLLTAAEPLQQAQVRQHPFMLICSRRNA